MSAIPVAADWLGLLRAVPAALGRLLRQLLAAAGHMIGRLGTAAGRWSV